MASYTWLTVEDGRATGTQVTDVVDGDTIDALLVEAVAFGNQLTHRVRLRLARVNAAKGPTGSGTAATAFLRVMLSGPAMTLSGPPVSGPQIPDREIPPVRALVTLKPYKFGGPAGAYRGNIPGGPADYGGEYMVEVELADGRMVSDVMVEAGHARYWDGTGPRPGDG
jgi:endonuclease YncB( thermonuclease family)